MAETGQDIKERLTLTTEAKIRKVDEKGAPTIVLRERGVTERLIESFMYG